ncbi:hypothetical protein [Brevibacillus choshinensis]|uniref:Uncharacterized protein n=1 Tax=Brevibacillus choshinensis TaxID=54911 RepID=A0ABX7FNV8_BRECH|nr:hypothetical protein [Brevibacillus choshinensis]QRG67515.1 hypothetical protein JNE38_29505 [Brevibacillus choshinensis]
MKKRMAMAAMALAVSAMAGSAFAADEPGKTTSQAAPQNTVKAQLVTMPAISLEQMAKEKGMTVEALIAQLQKEGKLTKATKALEIVSIKPNDGSKPVEGTKTITASTLKMAHINADGATMMEVINLEDLAKEKGITVDEFISQLEKEGKLAQAVKLVPATPVHK